MVRRFVFGEPMNTGAVVADIPAETELFSLIFKDGFWIKG